MQRNDIFGQPIDRSDSDRFFANKSCTLAARDHLISIAEGELEPAIPGGLGSDDGIVMDQVGAMRSQEWMGDQPLFALPHADA
jgi:hypothetical protein